MKKEFFAFIKPTEGEIKAAWDSCIFSFDANILLNFYRYTADTTAAFFDLLEKFRDRIYITYQACEEYFENRLDVISEQEKAYSEVINAMQKSVLEPLLHERKHPHINSDLLNELTTVTIKVTEELDKSSKEYSKKISKDEILERVVSIFDGKVGKSFSEEQLSSIYQEGDKRYSERIPPGFKDISKGGVKQFGDLVLWFQMIELAKDSQKDLVFVTDDEKEDWLNIHKGKTIGPLPLLQEEFYQKTGKRIYLYTAPQFIKKAGELLNTQVPAEALAEVNKLHEEKKLNVEGEPPVDKSSELMEDRTDEYIINAIHAVETENGWAELAPLGVYLIRNTPLNYRTFGFTSLRRFIESRGKFEIKALQRSPNAKAVDTAFVRIKPSNINSLESASTIEIDTNIK